MALYDVKFMKDALEDIEDIILYIANDNKTAALNMHDIIVQKANDLALFPKRGRLIPENKLAEAGFRMLPIGKYIIFYKIDGDTVYIHRVLHAARNYPLLFDDINKEMHT